ncbi:MAG: murein transglycosylase A [Azoarcus sp.]|jgi:membrane-bound lytic murein transglycosylase A|nr:murein transglycosylase A [Azoarcus sp.]
MSQLFRHRFTAIAGMFIVAFTPACTQLPLEADDYEARFHPVDCPDCSVPASANAIPPPTGSRPPAPSEPAPPPEISASFISGWRAANWESLPGWRNDEAGAAWPAFRESCRVLDRKPAWQEACAAASALPVRLSNSEARQFFEQRFTPWQSIASNGEEEGLVTGYYEPLIRGSRQHSAATPWPILAPPDDLLTIDIDGAYPDLKPGMLRGRLAGNKVVPYWTRAELEQHRNKGTLPARALLWAADPIDLFFLQVQGSGQVELPDGSRVRVGFADHNGHTYRSIGSWLIRQGELAAHQASMEGIRQWAQRNPRRLDELLNSNPRYVFFRELPQTAGGPIGAQGTPLFAGRSIAVDPARLPLGAPIYLATTWPLSEEPLNRLVMAQDTGSAIKGAVRADFFWGFGPEAGAQAGKMKQKGRIWVLWPRGITPGQADGR